MNFQCWGILLIWIIVGPEPTVLAVCAGGNCSDIFSVIYLLCYFLSPSQGEGQGLVVQSIVSLTSLLRGQLVSISPLYY